MYGPSSDISDAKSARNRRIIVLWKAFVDYLHSWYWAKVLTPCL